MKKHRTAPEVKEQIINRIKNDGISVVQAAQDHGVSEATIYGWIAKKVEGQPTLSEVIKLKRENIQLLQLVGEITLKLSDTQKKKWGKTVKPPKRSVPESLVSRCAHSGTSRRSQTRTGGLSARLRRYCAYIRHTDLVAWHFISR